TEEGRGTPPPVRRQWRRPARNTRGPLGEPLHRRSHIRVRRGRRPGRSVTPTVCRGSHAGSGNRPAAPPTAPGHGGTAPPRPAAPPVGPAPPAPAPSMHLPVASGTRGCPGGR